MVQLHGEQAVDFVLFPENRNDSICKFLEVINNCNNAELLKQHRLITPRLKAFYKLIPGWLEELLEDPDTMSNQYGWLKKLFREWAMSVPMKYCGLLAFLDSII
jgi:hypothetical protein